MNLLSFASWSGWEVIFWFIWVFLRKEWKNSKRFDSNPEGLPVCELISQGSVIMIRKMKSTECVDLTPTHARKSGVGLAQPAQMAVSTRMVVPEGKPRPGKSKTRNRCWWTIKMTNANLAILRHTYLSSLSSYASLPCQLRAQDWPEIYS